jgi:hypothetical protein
MMSHISSGAIDADPHSSIATEHARYLESPHYTLRPLIRLTHQLRLLGRGHREECRTAFTPNHHRGQNAETAFTADKPGLDRPGLSVCDSTGNCSGEFSHVRSPVRAHP